MLSKIQKSHNKESVLTLHLELCISDIEKNVKTKKMRKSRKFMWLVSLKIVSTPSTRFNVIQLH